jgi:arginine utilization regulatory protein
MVERLIILCEDSVIDAAVLPPNLVTGTRMAQTRVPSLGEDGVNLNALVRELEGRMINEALKQTGGNKQAAARLLGLKRTTFSAKLRRCGVIAPSGNGREEV